MATETAINDLSNEELWHDTLEVLAREAPLTTRRNVGFQNFNVIEKETPDGLLVHAGSYNHCQDIVLTSRKYLENICAVANNRKYSKLSEDEKDTFFSHVGIISHELTHAYLEREFFKLLISRAGVKPAYCLNDFHDNITEEEFEVWHKSGPFIEGVAYGLCVHVPGPEELVDKETSEYVYNTWGTCAVDEIRMAARKTIRRAYAEKRTDFLPMLKEEIEKPNTGLNWLFSNN
jgi:hypothetical protein